MADLPPMFDSTVPHSARVWNYWLGGKDHFPADRAFGDEIHEACPAIVDIARASRGFLSRAVRHLAGCEGIRQFLDVGAGLPAADNTHEIAQRVAPESRVVYVDNDPLVLVHARALLTSSPEGEVAVVDADARDPHVVLAEAAKTLDWHPGHRFASGPGPRLQPVALLLLGVLGDIGDTDQMRITVDALTSALPSGSCLAVNEVTVSDEEVEAAYRRVHGSVPLTPQQVAGFFAGLALVEPGLVPAPLWRPERRGAAFGPLEVFCGVARTTQT